MTCTLTHAEHMATWQSWRDDCTDLDGCGFAVRDEDQCDRGHPDDGITWCGACGHTSPAERAAQENVRRQAAHDWRQLHGTDLVTAQMRALWHVHADDTIGGWAVMPADQPPSSGIPAVASFLAEEAARHIAELHNAALGQTP